MAILFYQKKKKELYIRLLVVFLIVFLIFLWMKFWPKPEGISVLTPGYSAYQNRNIQINFEELENQLLKDLQPFTPMSFSSEQELGRDNPFVPYAGTSTAASVSPSP